MDIHIRAHDYHGRACARLYEVIQWSQKRKWPI